MDEITVVTLSVSVEETENYVWNDSTVAGSFQVRSDANDFAEQLEGAVEAFINMTDCTTLIRLDKDVARWLLDTELTSGEEWIMLRDTSKARIIVYTDKKTVPVRPSKYKDFFGVVPFPDEEST